VKYAEFLARRALSHEELLAHAHGRLVDDAPPDFARLPTPPLLMFDRVTDIERAGVRGRMVAEQDVRLDAWYFQCHFVGDPVQPGCLGVDAVWQLVGLFMCASGSAGTGRALGCKEVEFFGQIRPHNRLVKYEIEIKRYTQLKDSGASMALADARVLVDDQPIYTIYGAKVGCFLGIKYPDYPHRSENAIGGILKGKAT
jgi:3-hydroxyacyl-[acyl-carrier protein] dehydratase/trans-2-decenoyl-[acyl-carrier protein] isomerase